MQVSNQQATIESNICKGIDKLHQLLDARKTELISQLKQEAKRKLKTLAIQKDEIKTTQAQLHSCLEFIQKKVKVKRDNISGQKEALMMKTTIVKQVEELTTTFQPEPNTEADIVFSTSMDLTRECQNYGQVVLKQDLPNPSECCATGEGVEAAIVGETPTVVLQANNYKGQPCQVPIKLDCELVSEITGISERGGVDRRGESQYKITYQPTIKGRHQLYITVEGHNIRGSPFSIAVTSPVKNLGTPIRIISGLRHPCGVTVHQSGEVIVSELNGDCVSVFSPNGEKLRSFGTHGFHEGQLDHPAGVAIDLEGNILVADCWNHRIQKFTILGQFMAAVGTKGHGRLQFQCPMGITVNPKNNKIYVCDTSNNRIQVLNSDFTFSSTFGKKGTGKRQFDSPYSVSCTSAGKVFVADSDNNCLQIFTAEGKLDGRGEVREELVEPVGVAIDTKNMVYVVEYGNHQISLLAASGEHVTSFGRNGGRDPEEKLDYPWGVAVDRNGVVYVCDSENNRVMLF